MLLFPYPLIDDYIEALRALCERPRRRDRGGRRGHAREAVRRRSGPV